VGRDDRYWIAGHRDQLMALRTPDSRSPSLGKQCHAWHEIAAGQPQSAPATSASSPASPVGSSVEQAKTVPPGGVLAATSTPTPAAPKLPPVPDTDGKLVLQIATTESSWVAIDADGKSVMQGVMAAKHGENL